MAGIWLRMGGSMAGIRMIVWVDTAGTWLVMGGGNMAGL